MWQRAGADAKPFVEIASPAVQYFQDRTLGLGIKWSDSEPDDEVKSLEKSGLPGSESYVAAITAIIQNVELSLIEFPNVRKQLLSIIYANYVPAVSQQFVDQILHRQHALETMQPTVSIKSVALQHALPVTNQKVSASGAESFRHADGDWTNA